MNAAFPLYPGLRMRPKNITGAENPWGCQLGTPTIAQESKASLIGFQLLARPHNDIPGFQPGNIANYHSWDGKMSGFGDTSQLSSGDRHKSFKKIYRGKLSPVLCQEGSGALGSSALSSPSGEWVKWTEKET